MKKTCYRHTAQSDELWQAVSTFEPREDGTCEYYWANGEKSVYDNGDVDYVKRVTVEVGRSTKPRRMVTMNGKKK